jgi:hypothetical protein
MKAAHVMRPRFDTIDYADREEVTNLVIPLVRRSVARLRAGRRPSAVATRGPIPMIVDKRQLVRIARVLRPIPKTVSSRVPRLSLLVIEQRALAARRERVRTWLVRIAFLAVVELVAALAVCSGAARQVHDGCVAHGWCAGAHQ